MIGEYSPKPKKPSGVPAEVEVVPVACSRDSDERGELFDGTAESAEDEDSPSDAPEDFEKPEPSKKAKRTGRVVAITAGIAAVLTLGGIIGYSLQGNGGQVPIEPEPKALPLAHIEPVDSTRPQSAAGHVATTPKECSEHVWMPVIKEVKYKAETHEVEHPEVTSKVTTYHTVCNVCMEVIDGETAEHEAETGHSAWTTNVPITSEEVTEEAWTETVEDEPERTALEQTGEKCSRCGAERDLATEEES